MRSSSSRARTASVAARQPPAGSARSRHVLSYAQPPSGARRPPARTARLHRHGYSRPAVASASSAASCAARRSLCTTTASHASPSQPHASIICSAHAAFVRVTSRSSSRTSTCPPRARASSHTSSPASNVPGCASPVVDGANLDTTRRGAMPHDTALRSTRTVTPDARGSDARSTTSRHRLLLARRPARHLGPVGVVMVRPGQERPCSVVQCRSRIHVYELFARIPANPDLRVLTPQIIANVFQLYPANPEIQRTRIAMRRRQGLPALHAIRRHELDRLPLVLLGDVREHRERLARDRPLAIRLTAAEQMLHLGRRLVVHRAIAPDAHRRTHVQILVVEPHFHRRSGALDNHHRERFCRYRCRARGSSKSDRSRRGEFELEDYGQHISSSTTRCGIELRTGSGRLQLK